MQKIALIFIFLLSSCTIVKERPPQERGLILFEKVDGGEQAFYQNKALEVVFSGCTSVWTKDGAGQKYLREEFKNKFNEDLLGLSNVTIHSHAIIDSSIFILNEYCYKFTANPVTKAKLNRSKMTNWVLEMR